MTLLSKLYILLSMMLLTISMMAQDSLPIVEIKADRTIIYPQRMELTGEETLMDVLQMVPDLMIAGYQDVLSIYNSNYNLRIDNAPINGDNRLIISQMKAKDIEKIQICDNTGVAKGTIGTNNVLDINMKMPDGAKGFVEGQGDFGYKAEGYATANMLYGSKGTDLYANATYSYQEGKKDYVTLHMTNRFDERNKLLTYFTQQFIEMPYDMTRKVMGRARYFHTFNDMGTELLILGGYQYSSDPYVSNKLPMYVLELNTPLFTKSLSMMLGTEGDYLISRQKDRDWGWHIFNHDIYLQFTYTLPRWRFTAGNRIMFYGYKLSNNDESRRYSDTRNNTNACAIFVPNNRNQWLLGYYRKYYNPAYEALFLNTITLSYDDWLLIEDELDEWDINQVKLAYTYSKPKLTIQAEASHYIVEDDDNFTELNSSVYWKNRWLTLTGGAHIYFAKDNASAALRLSPAAQLPHQWQIGMQMVYYTKKAPQRTIYGTPVYGCLTVSKQLDEHWFMSIDWHDMIDPLSDLTVTSRHAGNIKLQYRF